MASHFSTLTFPALLPNATPIRFDRAHPIGGLTLAPGASGTEPGLASV